MKRTSRMLGLMLMVLLISFGCQKENHTGTGAMRVKMTDAPIDFDSVNVEVLQVSVHYSDNATSSPGWMDLPTNAGIYNLLDLQNDVTTVLVNNNQIPAGDITQMRLILGQNNTVVVDSVSYPLEMSSQYNTGIKINLNSTIAQGDTVEVLLDFDAEESIVVGGQTTFKLKPVIRLESIIYL